MRITSTTCRASTGPGPWLERATGPVEGYIDFTYGDVASYRAVDDDTVEFKFKKPSAPFLNSLAMVWNGLVSPAGAAKWGKDYRNHPVGSGPFVLREWRQRDQIILDANPDYLGRQAEGRSHHLQGDAGRSRPPSWR